MKTTVFLVFFFFISFTVYSQLSDSVKQYTNQLSIIDSLKVEKKYNNGKTKETYTLLTYKYGDYSYETYSGSHLYYFKKTGNVFLKYEYDKFGYLIKEIHYNKKGKVYKEKTTISLDTEAKSINEFLNTDKHLIITTYEKNYAGNDLIDLRLSNEGKRINGKKKGIWKIYSFDKNCDPIMKEKIYN